MYIFEKNGGGGNLARPPLDVSCRIYMAYYMAYYGFYIIFLSIYSLSTLYIILYIILYDYDDAREGARVRITIELPAQHKEAATAASLLHTHV